MSAAKKETDAAQDNTPVDAASASEAKEARLAAPQVEDVQLHGEAIAQHDESPKSAADALAFMQRFGSVPSGWTFDSLTGMRKAD